MICRVMKNGGQCSLKTSRVSVHRHKPHSEQRKKKTSSNSAATAGCARGQPAAARGRQRTTHSTAMAANALTPPLMRLFAPRGPIDALPEEKRSARRRRRNRTRRQTGVADFTAQFETPNPGVPYATCAFRLHEPMRLRAVRCAFWLSLVLVCRVAHRFFCCLLLLTDRLCCARSANSNFSDNCS